MSFNIRWCPQGPSFLNRILIPLIRFNVVKKRYIIWSKRISTPVQNAIKICFWFFKWKDENFKINARCSVNKSRYVREHTAFLLYKQLESTDTYIRKCRTYCCVSFSHAALALKKTAVSVIRYAPSKEEWRLNC
jgi:hypothetical protein